MNARMRQVAAAMIVAGGLGMAPTTALADDGGFKQLSGEWWQWALSIPTGANPLADDTGANCMVGQRGGTWFLAGSFTGPTVVRDCDVPEGTALFFPVINYVNLNTPNVCGQNSNDISAKDLRAQIAPFIDSATNVVVTLDGKAVRNAKRVQSEVFSLALPEDNLFDAGCAPAGVPEGIYSPAIGDGIYVKLEGLSKGAHTLRFSAEIPGFALDITYNLVVVNTLKK